MKYQNLIEQTLAATALRKVQIKTDPAETGDDFEYAQSYTGYILAENPESANIIVMKPNLPIEEYPLADLEIEAEDESAESFQLFAITHLTKQGKALDDPIIQAIGTSENLGEVENNLRQVGMTDSDIIKLYRSFIENETD